MNAMRNSLLRHLMVMPFDLVRLLVRPTKRCRVTALFLLGTVMVLWLTFVLSDRRSIVNFNKGIRDGVLEESKPHVLPETSDDYWMTVNENQTALLAPEGEFGVLPRPEDNSQIVRLPVKRRGGPVPHEETLDDALQYEENAAKEEIDSAKGIESNILKASDKHDDNAAREEHSGEVATLGRKIKLEKKLIEKRNSAVEAKRTGQVEDQEDSFHQLPEHQKELPEDKYDSYNNWRNLTLKEIHSLSALGRRLFLNEKIGQEQNKIFTIHIWKYKKFIENRLLKRFGSKPVDPFEGCSVSNCRLTSDDVQVEDADAVLFHLHRIAAPPSDVPRKANQIWVWLSDESPYNLFLSAKVRQLDKYSGYFNWSMTYRMDADVPVPYGRTVPLPKDRYLEKVDDIYNQKPQNISILGSNCGGRNHRYKYVKELQKHIPVDVYGGCGPLKCSGHFNRDCPKINDYKFYLAFENSNCDDYITEKVWWNALSKDAVPIVMGGPRRNYERMLPPHSFISVEDFSSPKELAQYLRYLLDNPSEYQEYHQWRRWYRVLNEHGYFQSPACHFCRLCEALNYNGRAQAPTADLVDFFDPRKHCYGRIPMRHSYLLIQ